MDEGRPPPLASFGLGWKRIVARPGPVDKSRRMSGGFAPTITQQADPSTNTILVCAWYAYMHIHLPPTHPPTLLFRYHHFHSCSYRSQTEPKSQSMPTTYAVLSFFLLHCSSIRALPCSWFSLKNPLPCAAFSTLVAGPERGTMMRSARSPASSWPALPRARTNSDMDWAPRPPETKKVIIYYKLTFSSLNRILLSPFGSGAFPLSPPKSSNACPLDHTYLPKL